MFYEKCLKIRLNDWMMDMESDGKSGKVMESKGKRGKVLVYDL
jgi:hypothetical protein